ncbi:uncharacterized protein SCHCODRAFT_02754058 [Schizophyllum commune H4-8]|uniref:uncharacterized protein n=1 Tax=Schizophyllum commune (strain H4-8 / FGSC 9210) TaxID=578458 RepID=UPI00215E9F90|nr:uncharacterized protein SCHCODRAFT_02754058 [Schizophyllum commune H4-8]KAI5836628.1 hypothetical protein SCHCODRAFT_02754058 [Schizophyllum commune H4-8]
MMAYPAAPQSMLSVWLDRLDPRNWGRGRSASLINLVRASFALAVPARPGVSGLRFSATLDDIVPASRSPHPSPTNALDQSDSPRPAAPGPPLVLLATEPVPVPEFAPAAVQGQGSPPGGNSQPQASNVNDPMVRLWEDAVKEYQESAGVNFSVDPLPFCSAADIDEYVRGQEVQFKVFRDDGPQWLRERLLPVATVLANLCDGIGNSLASAFPPGPVIFSAIGLLLKASTVAHNEFEAVCDAFDEIKSRISLINSVIEGHTLVREASVQLLVQVLKIFGAVSKMRKAGRFRVWLQGIQSAKPLSEALANLGKLGTRQHERIAAVTLEVVTELASSLASGRDDRTTVCLCMERVANLAHEIQANVEAGNAQAIEEIHKNREIVRLSKDAIVRASSDIVAIKDTAAIDKILEWLQYRDSSEKLSRLLNDRVPSTGMWFLNGRAFADFKKGTVTSLLLHGTAGCGKSTMIAAAFQDLQHYCGSHRRDAIVLVYFFDITNRADRQTADSLISSFLCQLALRSSDTATFLLAHRLKAMMRGHTTLEEKKDLLSGLLRSRRSPIYVLVDALDESDMTKILPILRWLQSHQATSLLITARALDGRAALRASVIHMDGVHDDVSILIDNAMRKPDGLLAGVAESTGLRRTLRHGAGGNLRWVSLIIDELAPVAESPSDVILLLKYLPQSLEDVYMQRLNSIKPPLRRKVKILLAWLITRGAPMSLTAFAQLQAFIYPAGCDMPIYDSSLVPSMQSAGRAVDSMFITVNTGSNLVSVAHASVQQFFQNLPPASPFYIRQADHALMARMCLAYVAACAKLAEREQPAVTLTDVLKGKLPSLGITIGSPASSGQEMTTIALSSKT